MSDENLPKIHPREQIVTAAERKLASLVTSVASSHNLTIAERMRVVTTVLTAELLTIAKFAIREERHGDADKPGGVE